MPFYFFILDLDNFCLFYNSKKHYLKAYVDFVCRWSSKQKIMCQYLDSEKELP
jgi:hypothetical protein